MDEPIKEFEKFLPQINDYLPNSKHIKIINLQDGNFEINLHQNQFFIKTLKTGNKQQTWYYLLGMRDLLKINK